MNISNKGKSYVPPHLRKQNHRPNIYEFLDTDLFNLKSEGFSSLTLELKNTNYVLVFATKGFNIKPSWRKVDVSVLERPSSLEEIFDNAPPEIVEKLIYHLDILPR